MKNEKETLGAIYENLCNAQYHADEINHPLSDAIMELRTKVGGLLLEAHDNFVEFPYPEKGVVIVHLEHATDDERKEVANSIVEFMNEKYPKLASLKRQELRQSVVEDISIKSRIKYVTDERAKKVADFLMGYSYKENGEDRFVVPMFRVLDALSMINQDIICYCGS